jgi:hypothetical protein
MENTGWSPTSMPRRETEFAAVPVKPIARMRVVEIRHGRREEAEEEHWAPRALRGEQVMVVAERIKADMKADFDRLLHEVIAPAALRYAADSWVHVRLLEPVSPNADGTWTYVTLIDPADKDAEYDRRHLLEREYGVEAADRYVSAYLECRVGDALIYETVQSVW